MATPGVTAPHHFRQHGAELGWFGAARLIEPMYLPKNRSNSVVLEGLFPFARDRPPVLRPVLRDRPWGSQTVSEHRHEGRFPNPKKRSQKVSHRGQRSHGEIGPKTRPNPQLRLPRRKLQLGILPFPIIPPIH